MSKVNDTSQNYVNYTPETLNKHTGLSKSEM